MPNKLQNISKLSKSLLNKIRISKKPTVAILLGVRNSDYSNFAYMEFNEKLINIIFQVRNKVDELAKEFKFAANISFEECTPLIIGHSYEQQLGINRDEIKELFSEESEYFKFIYPVKVDKNCYTSAYYGTTMVVSSYGIYWTAHGDDGCHCETEEIDWNTLETIKGILEDK